MLFSTAPGRGLSPAHSRALDGLRALAILLVLLVHSPRQGAPAAYLAVTRYGWTGVDLFFVLSGFLIGGQLLASAGTRPGSWLWQFYGRRLLRILPAYLATVAVYFLVRPLREDESARLSLLRYLTFTMNFAHEGGNFTHAWSLCIEEQFYLLMPLGVMLLKGWLRPWQVVSIAGLLLAGGILLRLGLWSHYLGPRPSEALVRAGFWKWIYFPTWSRLDGLLAGVLLASVRHAQPSVWSAWRAAPRRWAGGALLLLALGAFLVPRCRSLWGAALVFPVLALGFGSLMVFALSPPGERLLGRVPGSSLLARLAYSLYLTHRLAFNAVDALLTPHGVSAYHPLRILTSAAAILLFAAALHWAVERPFLRLRDRWVPAPPSTASPSRPWAFR